MRLTFPTTAYLLLGVVLAVATPAAEAQCSSVKSEDKAAAAAELQTLLDKRMMNTIPREKAVMKLRDLKASRELVRFLDVPRLNAMVIWALSEIGDPRSVAPVLKALDRMDVKQRPYLGRFVASFRTPEVRAWLEALSENEALSGSGAERWLLAARLRAGDPAVIKRVGGRLKSKDSTECASALLAMGDSREPAFLERIARFTGDRRSLDAPAKSVFGVEHRKKLANGGWSCSTVYPELKTVAEVALEAASRVVQPMTPEQIAWWHEMERAPRFPPDEDGAKRLKAFVDAERKAARKGVASSAVALHRLFDHIRASKEGEMAQAEKVKILAGKLTSRWEFTIEMLGSRRTATVDVKRGKVTIE